MTKLNADSAAPVARIDPANIADTITRMRAGERRAISMPLPDKALSSGRLAAMLPMDLGFMYGRSIYNPDGHHWEIFHMYMSAMPS
jgi:uncharacterized protein